jgi:hypothetical protein
MKKLVCPYLATTITKTLHGSQQECRTQFAQEHRILHQSRDFHRKNQFQASLSLMITAAKTSIFLDI